MRCPAAQITPTTASQLAIVNHLAHPNIVQFMGAITNTLPLCIVTEYMNGGNLADKMLGRGLDKPFPVGRVAAWMLDTYVWPKPGNHTAHAHSSPQGAWHALPARTTADNDCAP